MRKHTLTACMAIAGAIAFVGEAGAADIGVAALKYISIDKDAAAGKSKTVYVAKVPEADKHSEDVNDIAVGLKASYAGESGDAAASFEVPFGPSVDKGPGWLVNKATVAKFVNKSAPGGPTGAKVTVIKPGILLKLIAKTRGDSEALDMIGAGAPTGNVYTEYDVTSGGITDRFCSVFSGCSYKVIGGGSGRKLVCKSGSPDPQCLASSFCGNGVVEGSEQCDDGNVDPTDGCTNACTICGDGVTTAPEACDDGAGTCSAGMVAASCVNDAECDTMPDEGDGVCDLANDGTTCAANCQLPGCGNGLVEPGETCDDGNTDDGDDCPSNCAIAACTPNQGSDLTATVNFTGSANVANIQVFVDYPEGQVIIPGTGDQIPFGILDGFPNDFAQGIQPNDLDYALRLAYVDSMVAPQGQLFQIHFETCQGQPAPTDGDFSCVVEDAGDLGGNPIGGVTCSVDVP